MYSLTWCEHELVLGVERLMLGVVYYYAHY